jgi:hypothetical protein
MLNVGYRLYTILIMLERKPYIDLKPKKAEQTPSSNTVRCRVLKPEAASNPVH